METSEKQQGETETVQERILAKMRETERYIQKVREVCDKRLKSGRSEDNRTIAYERARLIGMMDICDLLGIDRTEFNWVINI